MPNYSKKKIAELQATAKGLGIITRSNMSGPKLEEKITAVQGGAPLESVNPAPRGSKNGTAKVAAPKAPAAAKAAPAAKAPQTSKLKKQVYNLYAADGNELSYAVMAEGATPQEAAQAATEAGDIAPETPLIAVPLDYVSRPVSVKRIEQPPIYEAVTVEVAKPKPANAPKAAPKTPTPAAAPAAPKPGGSARKGGGGSARKSAPAAPVAAPVPDTAPPLPPAPGAVDDNPFAS